MKRYILLPLLAVAFAAQAQDTFINERLTNNSSDVIGTARYVGMGGALGALGADISVISWNPAGIGLYRKNDISLTFGGTWGKSYISQENRGKGTVDQAGFVYNMKIDSETCPYINFSFNFQKKLNYNQNFYASNGNLGGLSQMDQLAELTDYYTEDNNGYWPVNQLSTLALRDNYFMAGTDNVGNYYYNDYPSSSNFYTHHSEGSLQSFDFNLSTNIKNRAFLGLTVGVDNMRFRGWDVYGENDMNVVERYDLLRDFSVSGTGVNVKLGTIVRPFESNSFRVGFVVETPTWYRLRNSTFFNLYDCIAGWESARLESYLKFNIRSPWKVRTSIGSTIGSSFAWDIDYEYAAYAGTSMGYPEYEYFDGSTSGNMKDVAMNEHVRDNLRGTHTLRVGLEANATKNLAFRVGYNLSTSAYKNSVSFDQYSIHSTSMDYATSTSYMRMGTTNIITLGMGYHAKNFYVDLAYKIRNQKADYYAFDTSFAETWNDTRFVANNPTLADKAITPDVVDLTRHAITCTLGFKF